MQKKKLVETILIVVRDIGFMFLVTILERHIRHFNETDIVQFIHVIKNIFLRQTSRKYEFHAFQTFLETRVVLGNQKALSILKNKITPGR